VGCFEDEDSLLSILGDVWNAVTRDFAGPVQDTAPYYAIADVLVLPSHREGLPRRLGGARRWQTVVGALATGICRSLVDGETGLLFPWVMYQRLLKRGRLISDRALPEKWDTPARKSHAKFQQEKIWEALYRRVSRTFANEKSCRHLRPNTGKSAVWCQVHE